METAVRCISHEEISVVSLFSRWGPGSCSWIFSNYVSCGMRYISSLGDPSLFRQHLHWLADGSGPCQLLLRTCLDESTAKVVALVESLLYQARAVYTCSIPPISNHIQTSPLPARIARQLIPEQSCQIHIHIHILRLRSFTQKFSTCMQNCFPFEFAQCASKQARLHTYNTHRNIYLPPKIQKLNHVLKIPHAEVLNSHSSPSLP